jgi:serine/threonine-protein kinase
VDGEWIVPGFRHVRQLGEGATGLVMQGEHLETGTPVAIKYLSNALLHDEDFIYQFREEARILAELRDPNLVAFHEYVESPFGAAIIMELVDGVSLATLINSEGPTGAEVALYILKGSLLGLAAAHSAGLVHRDYKPGNILVDGAGTSKLADFGVAVRAGDNVPSAGTPAYMAPEQWGGRPVTPATDIYAATAVFYECLTGLGPYPNGTLPQLALAHRTAPIPVATVPEPLRGIVERGLAKNQYDRPQSAMEFIAELEEVALGTYGPDWESQGRNRLAELAALLSMLFPLGHASTASGLASSAFKESASAVDSTDIADPAYDDYFTDRTQQQPVMNHHEYEADPDQTTAYESNQEYYGDDPDYYANRPFHQEDDQTLLSPPPPPPPGDDYGMDWGEDDGRRANRRKTLIGVAAGVAGLVLLGGATAAVYAVNSGSSHNSAAPRTTVSPSAETSDSSTPSADPSTTPSTDPTSSTPTPTPTTHTPAPTHSASNRKPKPPKSSKPAPPPRTTITNVSVTGVSDASGTYTITVTYTGPAPSGVPSVTSSDSSVATVDSASGSGGTYSGSYTVATTCKTFTISATIDGKTGYATYDASKDKSCSTNFPPPHG